MLPATPHTQAPTTPDVAELLRRQQRGLWRYLRQLGAAPDLAEDLMQDTFVIALRRFAGAPSEGQLAAFLRQTAQHLYLRRCRDRSRRERLLAEQVDREWQRDSAHDHGERWLAALRACVEKLHGRAREVVQRFYVDDQDRASIAAALGMKETGVKTLLQRVRATLRECIERSNAAEP